MKLSYIKSKRFLVPTLLCLAFLAIYTGTFTTGHRKYYDFPRMLSQWDGQHYLSIARDGYETFPCSHDPSYICGNVGWFPAYPLVARAVSFTGIDIRWAVLVTSWLALWLALLVMYRIVEVKYGQRVALGSIVALLVFPTGFYFLTSFPYSLYLLLAALAFYLMEREQYALLWLPSGLLAVTYPSGAALGLPILYLLISRWKTIGVRSRTALAAALIAIAAAVILYFAYYWLTFDDFLLYVRFQGQSYYAHKPTFPLMPIIRSLLTMPSDNAVFVMLLFIPLCCLLFYRRRLAVTWQIYMFAVLLFTPTMGTTMCYYRHIVVAFPLFVMIGMSIESKWRRLLFVAYIAASVFLAGALYVTAYKLGQLM